MFNLIFLFQEKLNIGRAHSQAIAELFRGIRVQMCNLITGKDGLTKILRWTKVGVVYVCGLYYPTSCSS